MSQCDADRRCSEKLELYDCWLRRVINDLGIVSVVIVLKGFANDVEHFFYELNREINLNEKIRSYNG